MLAQQNNGFQYCDTGATPWQCTSSTTTSSTIRTFLPDSLGAPAAFATVSTRLQLTFSSPAGAALTQLLAPYLSGSSASQLVGANATSTQTVEAPLQYTDQDLFAPVGPDRAFDVGVPMMGAVDVVNTRTDTTIEELYQTQQTLDAAALGFLLGDIYAAVPVAILDGDFEFTTALLDHARGTEQAPGAHVPGQTPLAFAAPKLILPAVDATAFAAAGSSGIRVAPGWTTWLNGAVGRSALTPSADHLGLSFSTADAAIGADYADGPWRAGGSIGVGRTGFDQPSTGDFGTITSFRAGAYAGFETGEWSLTGGLSGGYHWTQTTRLSGMPAPAISSFGSMSLSAGLEAARRFKLFGASFEPLAGAVLSLASTGGFTESGTALLDLKGQPTTTRALKLYVGGRVSGRLALADGIVVTPEAHARVLYDAIADPLAVTTSFAGDPSGTQTTIWGLQPGRVTAQLGAGIGMGMARTWRLAIAYRLQFRGGSDLTHNLSGSVSGKW